MGNEKEIITDPFESIPRIELLTNDQAKKLKDIFKDFTVVVRCKDCKHAEHCEIYAGWDGQHPDYFCADGERE